MTTGIQDLTVLGPQGLALPEENFISGIATGLSEIKDSMAEVFESAINTIGDLFGRRREVQKDTSSFAYQQSTYMRFHQIIEHGKTTLEQLQKFGVDPEKIQAHLTSKSFLNLIHQLRKIGTEQFAGSLLDNLLTYYATQPAPPENLHLEKLLNIFEEFIPDFDFKFKPDETPLERRTKVMTKLKGLRVQYSGRVTTFLCTNDEKEMNAIFLLGLLQHNTCFSIRDGAENLDSLIELAEGCRNNTFDPTKPTFVFFLHDLHKEGDNFAIYGPSTTEHFKKTIQRFSKTHNVVVHRMKSGEDAKKHLQSLKRKHGQRITDVMIAAHGNSSGMMLSDTEHSGKIDFSSEIETDGRIYLFSCSTAKRTTSGDRPYAELLSEAHPHVTVYAPPEVIQRLTIQFPYGDERPFVRFTTVREEKGVEKTERIFAKVFKAGREVPN
ncbi:hypothetical protein COB11_08605 [Candidatus Aerophobetes bacterium]|uniref:Uncharacterized protein n=1 Tax=Aerophobetes bacterium TaxID=2030807 RepID=A0A2A4YA06_UNCAE|nr:MAG: hypothetical protein COB11_08605 [Candidatus Aerophobetes bacterium]